MEVNPIALIFVYMDSKGDRLLYRYPYEHGNEQGIPATDKALPAATTVAATSSTTVAGNENERVTGNTTTPTATTMTTATGSNEATIVGPTTATDSKDNNNSAAGNNAIRKRNSYALNEQQFDPLFQSEPQQLQQARRWRGGVGFGVGTRNFGGPLRDFDDEVLSTLFATKPQLCNNMFELKVNDVRFVSHPWLIYRKEQQQQQQQQQQSQQPPTVGNAVTEVGLQPSAMTAIDPSSLPAATVSPVLSLSSSPAEEVPSMQIPQSQQQQVLINIVFALPAQASFSVVKCYYELSKRIGLALKFEEQRCGYVTEETTQMAATHDAASSKQLPVETAFDRISEHSSLAQSLKHIYHELCSNGLLNATINQFLTLSFCLPQKAHQLHKKGSLVDPEKIERCLSSLKPYHGMLLLVDFAELLDCVPPTATPMLLQLIERYTPLMSLQNMASEAEVVIENVYKLVSHLVYWAKATIIYPLCETNVYVIAPDAPLHTKSHLVESFSSRFAGMSLFEVIADFSLPTSIGHLTTPLQQSSRQGILAQMVLWMLQHHLLMQLHTYVQFMPIDLDDLEGSSYNHNSNGSGYRLNNADGEAGVVFSMEQVSEPEDTAMGIEFGMNNLTMQNEVKTTQAFQNVNNLGSLVSISSQPLPVPNSNNATGPAGHGNSVDDDRDHYSADDASTISDNINAQPSSSHKSNFSATASISTENCESVTSLDDEEKINDLLQVFDEPDRAAIRRIPASMTVEDLSLMVKLYQAGYFKSEHHLEEIMYFENLRRSQLLQLLDKFRDVLIIYETEDPAIASIYNNE